MATMIVKTEVEATPDLVMNSLRAFAKPTLELRFPYPAGAFVLLKPEVLKSLGGLEDMPALVIMEGRGSALGMVAVLKPDGDVACTFIPPQQVVGPYIAPA